MLKPTTGNIGTHNMGDGTSNRACCDRVTMGGRDGWCRMLELAVGCAVTVFRVGSKFGAHLHRML